MNKENTINSRHQKIIQHICQYFPSLKCFAEKYLPKIFVNPETSPEHLAYLCPLCTENFILMEKSVGYVWTSEFSFDHFPPESVGGFQEMLVCKKCNNEAGERYDYSLKEKINRVSFERKVASSSIQVKSTISDVPGSYSSSFYIDEQGQFGISLKPYQKSHAPYLDEWIEKSKTDSNWELKITIPNPDDSHVVKALIKTAYLYCFANWGYEFVFSNTGERIRKFLKDEEQYPIKVPSFWLGESIRSNQDRKFPLGLCYLQKPEECKIFAVNIALKNKEPKFGEVVSVLIPNPTPGGWNDLKRIETFFSSKINVEISMAHVIDFSIADNIFDGYKRSWEELTNHK